MGVKTQLLSFTEIDPSTGLEALYWSDTGDAATETVHIRPNNAGISTSVSFNIKAGGGRASNQGSGNLVDEAGIFTVPTFNDVMDTNTGIYEFVDGQENYFLTPDMDISDDKLAVEKKYFAYTDENGYSHRVSKALNFGTNDNNISVTTSADGSVKHGLASDIDVNSVTTTQADVAGDVNVTNGGNVVAEGTVSAKALSMAGTYTPADEGTMPAYSIVRVVAV